MSTDAAAEAEELDAAARALGVVLTPDARSRLSHYLDLLERWNRAYNLTAVRDRAGMRVQHVYDCLAVVPPLRREQPGGGRVLDVGSGGGLPGAIIAITAPEFSVTCVDAVGKKAAFVQQVAGALGLSNLASAHGRVESGSLGRFDIVAARAYASLGDLVGSTRAAMAPGARWMAMKGRVPDDERAALPDDVEVFHVEHLQVPKLNAERCIVWMRPKLRYPPDPPAG